MSQEPIRIDDEKPSDVPGYHCQMELRVVNDRKVKLRMINFHDHDRVLEILKSLDATVLKEERPESEFTLRTNQVSLARRLALGIRRVAPKGNRHQWKIWPWSCPRTADALARLADLIMEYRKTGRCSKAPPLSEHSAAPVPVPVPGKAKKRSRPSSDLDDGDIFANLGID